MYVRTSTQVRVLPSPPFVEQAPQYTRRKTAERRRHAEPLRDPRMRGETRHRTGGGGVQPAARRAARVRLPEAPVLRHFVRSRLIRQAPSEPGCALAGRVRGAARGPRQDLRTWRRYGRQGAAGQSSGEPATCHRGEGYRTCRPRQHSRPREPSCGKGRDPCVIGYVQETVDSPGARDATEPRRRSLSMRRAGFCFRFRDGAGAPFHQQPEKGE